jgi:hypothetical protein
LGGMGALYKVAIAGVGGWTAARTALMHPGFARGVAHRLRGALDLPDARDISAPGHAA